MTDSPIITRIAAITLVAFASVSAAVPSAAQQRLSLTHSLGLLDSVDS